VRFKGRPGELSPKARFFLFAGWLLPRRFKYVSEWIDLRCRTTLICPIFTSDEPPFDRHDWIVRRSSTGEEVRYVIDYYGAPPLPDGSPVFSLDVRPALDSFSSISMRIRAATREAWREVVPDTSHA
jgi:cytochrome c heme-lyase